MNNIPEGFEKVCSVDSLKDRVGQRFMVNDVDIAVFKVDDYIYAVQNTCPHQHAAVIYDGFVEKGGCSVFCPVHGWEFNLETGMMPSSLSKLKTYKTLVEDGQLYVKPEKTEITW